MDFHTQYIMNMHAGPTALVDSELKNSSDNGMTIIMHDIFNISVAQDHTSFC